MASVEPQHADILAALRDLQQQQLFTDFTLQLKEGTVHVSKILLAAMSPVFRAMLSTDMTETRNNTVDMPHITMETWTCITQFYFSSEKLVSVENVVDVVQASHMYELDRLKEYCSDFLISTCSPDNCLSIQRMAAKLDLERVAKATTRFVVENFSAVCKCEDFVSLEKAKLLEVLEEEELVTIEDDLCRALLAWMENNSADVDTCKELFQHLRLDKLSDRYLGRHLLYHNVLSRTPSLQADVQEEVTRRMERSQYRQDQTVPLRRRRRRCNTPRSPLAVGHDSEDEFCMLQWSLKEKRWITCPGPGENMNGRFSAAVSQNTVVVTGGWHSRKTFLYATQTRAWTAGPDLLQARGYHGMAVIKGNVYVVAGYEGGSLSSIEEYSQTSPQWRHSGDLQIATNDCGVTSLGDTILVGGGATKESAQLIQTFNVETRAAAVLDVRLPRPMHHVRAAGLGSTAFFVGNERDLVQIREVDGTFQMTSHVILQGFGSEKKWFGLHVTDSCVRLIGGNGNRSVECWNYQGEKTQNDEVEDLLEEMDVYALLETDVPSH